MSVTFCNGEVTRTWRETYSVVIIVVMMMKY